MLLTNTSKIPLIFDWRLGEGTEGGGSDAAAGSAGTSAAGKEFAVLPAHGTVLPGGAQRVQIEFMPQVRGGGNEGRQACSRPAGTKRPGWHCMPSRLAGQNFCGITNISVTSSLVLLARPQLQSIQCYSLVAIMDQPGIIEAAATVCIAAECAVPVLTTQPADSIIDFGTTLLGFQYLSSL